MNAALAEMYRTQLLYIVTSIARQKQNSSDSTFKTAPESHNDNE